MNPREELLEKLETFQNMLISYSRYESAKVDPAEFKSLRDELLRDPTIKHRLPRFVRTHRDFTQFWGFIKRQSPSYEGRRQYICGEFAPVLDFVEHCGSPVDEAVSETLSRFDTEHVHQVWTRALERRADDPEGAITSARTLLETVCKHILDESGALYDDDSDLPKLYRLTAEALHLAPSQQSEDIFKRIFGGCQTVVENLGSLRNKLSDAHGKGRNLMRPEPRHAELAVNLSGAIAMFLVESWEAQQKS
jgi:hypothetical protein